VQAHKVVQHVPKGSHSHLLSKLQLLLRLLVVVFLQLVLLLLLLLLVLVLMLVMSMGQVRLSLLLRVLPALQPPFCQQATALLHGYEGCQRDHQPYPPV
jgi:hypothetical protein